MPDSLRDPLRDQLQTSLGSAYLLERELGGGGMSRVFVVDEVRLRRKLVVKVLAPELAAGLSAERFQREIELAARLQQANIVPLLTVGEAEGLPYYTMPFVDGLSLRARLERQGALPVAEGVAVLRDVARALAYAHDHGVMHRDIKPENILLSGAAAVVTDFGIAKALAASKTQTPGGTITQVGTSIGTPAYMAPEQAAGDPATDHRADLYALGCVAYEMLTGAAPFAGRPVRELLAAHLIETPAPLAQRRADTPPALDALVMRCLEKDPSNRPQSAGAVLEALDGIGPSITAAGAASRTRAVSRPSAVRAAAVVAVIAALVLGGRAMRARSASDTTPSNALSIAVLPFQNLGDSADAYFADGVTDAVRGKLAGLDGLTVIARFSSVSYSGTTKPPAAIASELGVRYILTGTVRFAGLGAARRVQVNPELVEIATGLAPASRWAQPFDAAITEVFAVQADIAARVATAMQGALGSADKARLAEEPTRNPAAYDAFLRGEALRTNSTSPRSLRLALAAYDEALRLDSMMLRGWAARSVTLSQLYNMQTRSPELARMALASAERAIALDSTRSSGHRALAHYYSSVGNDPAKALAAVSRVRAHAHDDVGVLIAAANIKSDLGQMEAARRDFAEAARLDPRSAFVFASQAVLLLRLGQVTEARIAAERQLLLLPNNMQAIHLRLLVELCAGDVPAARQVLTRATRELSPAAVVADVALYDDLGWMLDADQTRLLLSLGADAFDDDRASMAIIRAQQHGWHGDTALARVWGDSAVQAYTADFRAAPDDPLMRVMRGLLLAYAGRRKEAFTEVERGLALHARTPEGRESFLYSYLVYVAARTALLVGDRERALVWLTEARRAHYYASPAWLRVDPTWAPLRNDPRFAALLAAPVVTR